MDTYKIYRIYQSYGCHAVWSGQSGNRSRFWSGLVSDLIQKTGNVRIEVKRSGKSGFVSVYDRLGRLVWSRFYSTFWSAKRGSERFVLRYGLVWQ